MPKSKSVAIDANKLKWKDVIFFDEWDGDLKGKARDVGKILGRLIVGMTEEEIGELEIGEIGEIFDQVQRATQELVPKESESASPTS